MVARGVICSGSTRSSSSAGTPAGRPVPPAPAPRRERRAGATEAVEAVRPGAVVARAVRHDRVVGQPLREPAHDTGEVELARGRLRLLPGLVVGARPGGPVVP